MTATGLRLDRFGCVLFALCALCICSVATAGDSLPSWNDGPAKNAILEFVAAVTEEESSDYVEPAERIAVFDNDGTLWIEYPMYTQALFAFDRVKQLAPQHPEWKTQQPFKGVLEDDMKAVGASGMKGLMEIVMATHSGMTAAEFEEEVSSWLATTEQPRFMGLFVHHTDADREDAYDRKSHVGTLGKALDRADAAGWIIVSMKNDWKTVFPDR